MVLAYGSYQGYGASRARLFSKSQDHVWSITYPSLQTLLVAASTVRALDSSAMLGYAPALARRCAFSCPRRT